jgi:hypothetical protein
MKILFLDIDGVLNSKNFWIECDLKKIKNVYFDPILVKKINFILDEIPDLKIVVSSLWFDLA